MARKLFISFLGTGMYEECKYYYGDEFECHEPTRYIQRATLEQIGARNWDEEDAVCIFMTDNAKQQNWNRDIHTRTGRDGKEVEYNGLEAELGSMNLCAEVRAVEGLPIGNTADEIWEIFDKVYCEIQNGDELYIDLTHAFRYMPMLVLVLSDYAKFLKGTRLKQLSYGSFEARDKESNRAPIIDLMPLSALQNWTIASSEFVNLGNTESLKYAIKEELRPLLRDENTRTQNVMNINKLSDIIDTYVNEFITCRGISIAEGRMTDKLVKSLECVQNSGIAPLNPIIDTLRSSIRRASSMAERCYNASQWCFDKRLYQQSITLLLEGIITFFCLRHGIDYKDEKGRGNVGSAFDLRSNEIAGKPKIPRENSAELESLLSDEILQNQDFVNKYKILSDARNDFNHAGFRKKIAPQTASAIKKKVEESLDFFHSWLCGDIFEHSIQQKERKPVCLNLSNHSYKSWTSEQVASAERYGILCDYPFPQVDSCLTAAEINSLAENIVGDIFDKYPCCNLTVHVMGEMTLTYALVSQLKSCGIRCIASCSERVSSFDPETGVKSSVFKFEGFREY